MDHPLLSDVNKPLRQRVIQFLANGCRIISQGNIVFVCGGNDRRCMRKRFERYCTSHATDLLLFEPEFAWEDYVSRNQIKPFDIGEFEKIIGDLSFAVLIFPEAPGSFAETGYFSQIKKLTKKTLLALNEEYQKDQSFISLGPARNFLEDSIFGGVVQVPYKGDRAFPTIISKIRSQIPRHPMWSDFSTQGFRSHNSYELFCLTYKCVQLLRIATFKDVLQILRGLFSNRVDESLVSQIFAILVGSNSLVRVGKFGHYHCKLGDMWLEPRSRDDQNYFLYEVLSAVMKSTPEFQRLLSSVKV